MIIESKDDVVQLSGSLNKNQWQTIKAAAAGLLREHPTGIIIDCADLDKVSEEGAKTFVQAISDIESAQARIVVANLPPDLIAVCRSLPGASSQLPVADSVAAARASLRTGGAASALADPVRRASNILVPLVASMDLTYGAQLAGRLARSGRYELLLVYFLEVPRTLPLNTPLAEKDALAQSECGRAMQQAMQPGVVAHEYVERVRDATEGILAAIKASDAGMVVIGTAGKTEGEEVREAFRQLVDVLLHRAPCEVIVGRQQIQDASS
jgi:anti-anti-sigma regulatory factor